MAAKAAEGGEKSPDPCGNDRKTRDIKLEKDQKTDSKDSKEFVQRSQSWEVFGTSKSSFDYILVQSTREERKRLRRAYVATYR